MAQWWAKNFYQSKRWQKARLYALRRDNYLCQSPGCWNPAEEVHHIIPLTPDNIDDPNIATNPDNLKSLCRDCHFREHHMHDDDVLPAIVFVNGRPVVKQN